MREAAVPTTVKSDGIDRYPQEVESAVYFCTLDALTNVANYAEATHGAVTLAHDNGRLEFTVIDDGKGFDATSTTTDRACKAWLTGSMRSNSKGEP